MADSRHNTGLTLIEVMVAIVVMIIVSALVWKMSGRLEDRLLEGRQKEAFAILDSALREYYDAEGQFPLSIANNTLQENTQVCLKALNGLSASRVIVERLPKEQVKYLDQDANLPPVLYDVWNRIVDYNYVPEMSFPMLRSAGANGIFEPNALGASDDIVNR